MGDNTPAAGPPPAIEEPPTGHVWRLTFAFRGDSVQLISSERVEMLPPPPDADTEQASFRVELRDGGDRTLFTRRLRNPMRPELEVFSSNPERPMGYVPVAEPSGAFQVIVPDLPEAAHFVLELAEPAATAADGRALADQRPRRRELTRLRLRTRRPPAPGDIKS